MNEEVLAKIALEESQLAIRYLRFGGIPRYIARVDMSHEEMVEIAASVAEATLVRLQSSIMKELLDPLA